MTQIELPKAGDSIKQGAIFGSVESVKAVSDLFAPLSGKILRVNSMLHDAPEQINANPYAEGWMVEIVLADSEETSSPRWTPTLTANWFGRKPSSDWLSCGCRVSLLRRDAYWMRSPPEPRAAGSRRITLGR